MLHVVFYPFFKFMKVFAVTNFTQFINRGFRKILVLVADIFRGGYKGYLRFFSQRPKG